MDVSRMIQTARCRDISVRAERLTRHAIRKRSLIIRKNARYEEPNEKLRAVIAAVRTHTNCDMYLSVNMSASALYRQTLCVLASRSAAQGAQESQVMGEALNCIDKLNSLLSRC
jgi:hypothetical protein